MSDFFAGFFRGFKIPYSACGSVISVGEDAIEKLYPLTLAFVDKVRWNVFFNNPPVEIAFPAETLNFAVDELFFAAYMLTNALFNFATCDTDVKFISTSAPNHVDDEHESLTIGGCFAIILHA